MLSSLTCWRLIDGDLHVPAFYQSIIDYFEAPPGPVAKAQVQELLLWWDRYEAATQSCSSLLNHTAGRFLDLIGRSPVLPNRWLCHLLHTWQPSAPRRKCHHKSTMQRQWRCNNDHVIWTSPCTFSSNSHIITACLSNFLHFVYSRS